MIVMAFGALVLNNLVSGPSGIHRSRNNTPILPGILTALDLPHRDSAGPLYNFAAVFRAWPHTELCSDFE